MGRDLDLPMLEHATEPVVGFFDGRASFVHNRSESILLLEKIEGPTHMFATL
jgi:hypothetical protein